MRNQGTTKATFLTLLLFGFAVVFAQSVNLKHDIEHHYHGAQESCSIYLAFNGGFDAELYEVELPAVIESKLFNESYSVPLLTAQKSSFAIRAPPAFLQS